MLLEGQLIDKILTMEAMEGDIVDRIAGITPNMTIMTTRKRTRIMHIIMEIVLGRSEITLITNPLWTNTKMPKMISLQLNRKKKRENQT
jgi:hypothetical protein